MLPKESGKSLLAIRNQFFRPLLVSVFSGEGRKGAGRASKFRWIKEFLDALVNEQAAACFYFFPAFLFNFVPIAVSQGAHFGTELG